MEQIFNKGTTTVAQTTITTVTQHLEAPGRLDKSMSDESHLIPTFNVG